MGKTLKLEVGSFKIDIIKSKLQVNFSLDKMMCRVTMESTPSSKTPVRKAQRSLNKTSRDKKSVRFSELDNKVVFRHLLREELKQAWYQSNEYKEFQNDRLTTIRTLRSAKGDLGALDPSKQCVRGLEMNATPEIFQYRSVGIKATVMSVLQRQQVQRQMGLKDDGTLGMVSMVSSKPAAQLAAALALIDSLSF
jgi:hypothetical protein